MNSTTRKEAFDNCSLSISKLILRCLIFTVGFCVLSSILVIMMSAIFYSTENPTSRLRLGALIALYASTFITSLLLTKINGQKWLFGGLILGAMIAVLTLLLSFLVPSEASGHSIPYKAIIILVSLLAAFMGKRRDKSSHKRKNRPGYYRKKQAH